MDEHIEKSTDDARAGETPHVTRVVLGISLPLVIIAFVVLVWIYAF